MALGLGFRNAALAGVEDGFLVQGADRVAVGAGDVVGEDQQLGLGVDLGLVRQDQGVVAHPRVGLVGAGRTTIRPWKTPRAWSSTTPLVSWLVTRRRRRG
jgi:hypothetical protein